MLIYLHCLEQRRGLKIKFELTVFHRNLSASLFQNANIQKADYWNIAKRKASVTETRNGSRSFV
jgi:hypothetical protein